MSALPANNAMVASLAIGIGVFLLDRLHKLIQVSADCVAIGQAVCLSILPPAGGGWTGGEMVTVTPFFDYVLVWNTGISYGLLGGLSPEMLLLIMAGAMILLAIWWWRDRSSLTRIGLALAIGGALSNAIDRVIYGAVADFFHFHAFGWSFYVFNIADMAISAGVVLLVLDVFWPGRGQGRDDAPPQQSSP